MTDLITRAVLEKAILERLQTIHAKTRADLAAELEVTERRPTKHNGVAVGVVSKKRPARSATVRNAEALLEWAQVNRPDEVEQVVTVRVRPATVTAWLAEVKRGGTVLSETTGELVSELPGVVVSEGTPTLEVKLETSDAALAVFEQVLQGGLAEIEGAHS